MNPSERRCPDFLGIGVPKAGTTWLSANLRRHPEVWQPPIKELRYFNERHPMRGAGTGLYIGTERRKIAGRMLDAHIEKVGGTGKPRYVELLNIVSEPDVSDDWYRRIFAQAPGDAICGEITPGYAALPMTGIEHVAAMMPDARLILSMRDPIDRCWSHARMFAKNFDLPGQQTVKLAKSAFLHRCSDYTAIINAWTLLFAAERLLVVSFDDVELAPLALLERVCGHIGVGFKASFFPVVERRVGGGIPEVMPDELYAFLKSSMRPIYEALGADYPALAERWMAKHWP